MHWHLHNFRSVPFCFSSSKELVRNTYFSNLHKLASVPAASIKCKAKFPLTLMKRKFPANLKIPATVCHMTPHSPLFLAISHPLLIFTTHYIHTDIMNIFSHFLHSWHLLLHFTVHPIATYDHPCTQYFLAWYSMVCFSLVQHVVMSCRF